MKPHPLLRVGALSLALVIGSAISAPTPRMLLETVDLSNVAISPDGGAVAFRQESASIESNTYHSAWYVLLLDGSNTLHRVADGGLPLRDSAGGSLVESPQWSPDSQGFFYRALVDGEVQVWRTTRDASSTGRVTNDDADIESFVLGQDGHGLLYTVGATRAAIERAEQDEYYSGIRIDGSIHVGQGLYRSEPINGRLASRRLAGNGFVHQALLGDQPKRRKVFELQTLSEREATDADIRLFEQTAPAECDHELCRSKDAADFAGRPQSEEVIFTTSDYERGRAQSMHAWNRQKNTVRSIFRADGLVSPCHFAQRIAVCVAAGANAPPHLVSIDLDSGKTRTLFNPNIALTRASGPRAELLTWRDENGSQFSGQFFPAELLASGKPAPLVILYYDCRGYIRGGFGNEWPLASLAGTGIAGLCINKSPGAPRDQKRYDTGLSGIRSIVDILHRQGRIDRSAVGMGGFSFGSEVALWVAMKSDVLAALSVASPFLTPTYYSFMALQRDDYRSAIRSIWGVGSLEETPDRWREFSPAFQIDKIKAPLLMQLPEGEYLITMDYFTPLALSTTPVDFYVFPQEPHQKFQPRHTLAVYQRNIDWFRFWLQGYVDPNPRKAEQYRHWQAQKAKSE